MFISKHYFTKEKETTTTINLPTPPKSFPKASKHDQKQPKQRQKLIKKLPETV